MIKVLLISVELNLRNFCLGFKESGIHFIYGESLIDIQKHEDSNLSLILFDFCLIETGCVDSMAAMFYSDYKIPILVLASESSMPLAMKTLSLGAVDVITLPCCYGYLLAYIYQYALPLSDKSPLIQKTKYSPLDTFVGISQYTTELKRQISLAAKNDMPILILGETGTGKSRVARLIHELSSRRQYKFVEENAAAIQDTLIEGELFGTKTGAYTGALSRMGLFELAGKGTLFLDEIASISKSMQAKLLHVLETGEFRRVGDTQKRRADVRVITAANVPLNKWKDEGLFRKDLYYRITGIQVYIAPLKQRINDVHPLTVYFLDKFAERTGELKQISDRALKKLEDHHWPGNIRELQSCVQRAFHTAQTPLIKEEHISFIK